MVRLLAHFGLAYPCSAPLQVVAQHLCHAAVILDHVRDLGYHVPHSYSRHPLCQHLRDRMHARIRGRSAAAHLSSCTDEQACLQSGPARAYANQLACEFASQLQAMYGSLESFHQQLWGA